MVQNKKWCKIKNGGHTDTPQFFMFFVRVYNLRFSVVLVFRVRPRLLRVPLLLLAARAIRCVLGERGALPPLQS